MAPKPASRWADTDEDAAHEVRRKAAEREARRRKKEARQREETQRKEESDAKGRPSKRRKTTPDDDDGDEETTSSLHPPTTKLTPHHTHTEQGWKKCRSVERYEKLNDIEEGTYGWVARALDKATGNVVALKRLKLEPHDRSGLPVTGLREIQILRDCRHVNVVALHEVVVGEEVSKLDNSIFLVLEFVEHDLKGILDDMPEPFLGSEIKRLLLQLVQGVAYLHDHWILHRDLKTSNLLLNNRGQLKIADFGMARYVGDPPPPRLTQLVVTLWYRAPELLLGCKTYGPPIDMWSVGCIFAELVDREPLLQGANEMDQTANIFLLCGLPDKNSWPAFRSLPNASGLKLPRDAPATSAVRRRFPTLTSAAVSLLEGFLALDPDRRPSARDALRHEYFRQDPKPKPENMFPTFPSRAGQERRKRREPHAPVRGQSAAGLGDADFSGIFQGRDREERGAGFTLRMG
ncbi:hypothetical protein L249_7922 [Ophiocordyceps polyrhachis-furcata BCC 54312]|uniref:cyclin-dependent kinase n=1 Tax=Ophiocordyceps polyrhachis-furcata BCC 54312 TaxID=1330021 RepID=A0A367LHD1_9HYPO|nr:hypothetical protein L249_7922 [Ophiocordyceps polyrhachis-furcata BCC 54312]